MGPIVVPKRRHEIATTCRVITQKSAVFFSYLRRKPEIMLIKCFWWRGLVRGLPVRRDTSPEVSQHKRRAVLRRSV